MGAGYSHLSYSERLAIMDGRRDGFSMRANRVVLIEDTGDLQWRAPNLVAMRTKDGVASLSDLVRPRCACGPTAAYSTMFSERMALRQGDDYTLGPQR